MGPLTRQKDSGFSLVEVVIVTVLLAIIAASAMKAFEFISKQNVRVSDQAFAVQKAIQMMEELRGLMEASNQDVSVLDAYDNQDGGFKYTLSTRAEVNGAPGGSAPDPGDRPADQLSGNTQRESSWKYKRTIRVMAISGEDLARKVYVRVYRTSNNEVLAETASVLRTLRGQLYPTQVYDVFLIEIENIPGWWVNLANLRIVMGDIITDMQLRNSGLEFRQHLITRLAYGRDPFYTPYINLGVRADQVGGASPSVYFYPGTISVPDPGGAIQTYYDMMECRINANGTVFHDTTASVPYVYSLADQFNHAVREPDEERMYADHYAALPVGKKPEVSWRMLLDRMSSDPNGTGLGTGTEPDGVTPYDYRNAIIVNMHGEIFPMPPMRNYSDPAKDPVTYPSAGGTVPGMETVAKSGYPRAVTHPEQIRYVGGTEERLRVYTYCSSPTVSGAAVPDGAAVPVTITIGASVAATNITIRKCVGSASGVDYGWMDATQGTDYSVPDNTTVSTQTSFTIYSSPLRHGLKPANGGLPSGNWLYGLEYIPCKLTDPTTFFAEGTRDLADNVNNRPKNTARWVVRIAPTALPTRAKPYLIETRLGSSPTSAVPVNISRTYMWVGSLPPESERYQFMGDPRHMPYADVKGNGVDGISNNVDDDGYNWYFNTGVVLNGSANWPGFDKHTNANGFVSKWNGTENVDIPRFMQFLRNAQLDARTVFNSISGGLATYVCYGGEIGGDRINGLPSSLAIVETPWSRTGGTAARRVNDIKDAGFAADYNGKRVVSKTDGSWWGIHWLGEMFPDDQYTAWASNGNLLDGAGNFYRRPYNNNVGGVSQPGVYSEGTTLMANCNSGTYQSGSITFVNGGGDLTHFFVWGRHLTGTLTSSSTTPSGTGTVLAQDFNIALLPSLSPPYTGTDYPMRCFATGVTAANINGSGALPATWTGESVYASLRSTVTVADVWYNQDQLTDVITSSSTYYASGLLRMQYNGANAGLVVNGVAAQGGFGLPEIGKLCVAGLLRGFMKMGAPGVAPGDFPQLPKVTISSPTATQEFLNPTSINVVWSSSWTRWDNGRYTLDYPPTYTSTATVVYNVKFSDDNGATWKCAGDPSVQGYMGLESDDAACVQTSPFPWDVGDTTTYPMGQYLLNVEAYRQGRKQHYSYHERLVTIRRN
jgi:prepilin-type N-terminal cleavage/methylation domain-containing protein